MPKKGKGNPLLYKSIQRVTKCKKEKMKRKGTKPAHHSLDLMN